MCKTSRVNAVDSLDQLSCVVSDYASVEGAGICYIVIQFAAIYKLTDDEGHLDLFTTTLVPSGVLIEHVVFGNMPVVNCNIL